MRSSVGAKVEATLEAGFAPRVAERKGRVATGAAWEDVSGAPGRRGGVVVRGTDEWRSFPPRRVAVVVPRFDRRADSENRL